MIILVDEITFANGIKYQLIYEICVCGEILEPIPKESGIIVSIFLRNNSCGILTQTELLHRFPGHTMPTDVHSPE